MFKNAIRKIKGKSKVKLTFLFLLTIISCVLNAQTELFTEEQEGVIARLGVSSSNNLDGSYTDFLNQLTIDFNIIRYEEIYAGTSSPILERYRYFVPQNLGYIPVLKNALLTSGFFDVVEIVHTVTALDREAPVHIPPSLITECDNPVAYNDPATLMTNHFNYMEMPCAWEISRGDPNVLVAVIDIFFDQSHPDMANKFVDIKGTCSASQAVCHHGYIVSGGVAAIPNNSLCVAGTGHDTRVIGYCAGTSCSGLSGNRILANINTAIQDGVRVINVSATGIGVGGQAARDLVSVLTENNINLVVSSYGASHSDYANEPGVINVGQINADGSYVPYHPTQVELNTDICAPVFDVGDLQSPNADPNFLCHLGSGNASLSAGFVSGIIALMVAKNPCLTPAEIEIILKATSKPLGNAANHPNLGNAGGVNAYQAVLAASTKLPSTTITTNETWDYPRRVDGIITIPTGMELKITSTVGFSQFSKIVVEPGGRLLMDGARLTRDCGNDRNWLGIEVLGSPSSSITAQGYASIKNSSVEFATIGVSAFKRQTYTHGGGIVLVQASKLINCQKGLQIAKSDAHNQAFNLGRVSDTEFVITDDFPFENGDYHIVLDRVKRFSIIDCSFKDERTGILTSNLLQSGIWSSNATWFATQNNFDRLKFGIRAENIKSSRAFIARDNKFTANFMGISARAVDNFEASGNKFTIGGFQGPTDDFDFPNRQTGIMADECSGFFVKGNEFLAASTLLTDAQPVGIAMNNTNVEGGGSLNTEFNQVFRNTFTGLYRANVANGVNTGDDFVGGLRYICNTNIANLCTDFTVFDGRIAPLQAGLDGKSAGNTFSQDDDCNPFSDFDNTGGNSLTYNYFGGSTGNMEEPLFVPVSGFIKIVSQENECTDEDDKPGPVIPGKETEIIGKLSVMRQQYSTLSAQYTGLIDGGNTASLLSLVNSMTTLNRNQLYQQLMELSPWLSDEVLIASVSHNLFSTTQKQMIVSANPEGYKKESVRVTITVGGWFSANQLDQIQQATNTPSNRAVLEVDLHKAAIDLQTTLQALETFYLMDESENGVDYDVVSYYAEEGASINSRMRQIDYLIQAGNTAATATALTDLQAQATGSVIANFVQLKNLELALLNSNRDYEDVTSQEISQLLTLTTDNARAGVQAQNWLHLLGNEIVQTEARWGSSTQALQAENNEIRAESLTEKRAKSTSTYPILVSPNPSNTLFSFTYKLNEPASLSIYTATGQLIDSRLFAEVNSSYEWTPPAMQDGLYFYLLTNQEGQILHQGKLSFISK